MTEERKVHQHKQLRKIKLNKLKRPPTIRVRSVRHRHHQSQPARVSSDQLRAGMDCVGVGVRAGMIRSFGNGGRGSEWNCKTGSRGSSQLVGIKRRAVRMRVRKGARRIDDGPRMKVGERSGRSIHSTSNNNSRRVAHVKVNDI